MRLFLNSLNSAMIIATLLVGVEAHGAGVWRDPNHYVDGNSLAGLRFVAEFPAHVLTMIGTEDGAGWWMIKGTCSGPGMTEINFDFSSKGGPADRKGAWAEDEEYGESITWPDGNKWVALGAPTAAFSETFIGSSHGLFLDSAHTVPGTFAGVRVIAEPLAHGLYLVGSDDGTSWWALRGDCHGPGTIEEGNFSFVSQEYFAVDFTPKGGPNLVATWDHRTRIDWPDGNTWLKPPKAVSKFRAAPRPLRASSGAALAVVPIVLAIGALANLARKARAPHAAEQVVPPQL